MVCNNNRGRKAVFTATPLAQGAGLGPSSTDFLQAASLFRMHQTATLCAKPGSAPSATILIVDDEPEVRTVVAEFLEAFGYCVLQASGGTQALGRLHDNPAVRLLITDIRMPEMSGIELADLATEQNPELKVILISGYFVAQQVHRCFLRKPFRMKELEAAVRAELGTQG